MEEWRRVPSSPWIEASSFGRIRAEYTTPMPHGGLRTYTVQPHFGYNVGARTGAKARRMISRVRGKTVKVHRLICEAFHGTPAPGQEVLHADECGTNNVPSNLSWGTRKENLNAPGFLAYCAGRTGSNNPHAKGRT